MRHAAAATVAVARAPPRLIEPFASTVSATHDSRLTLGWGNEPNQRIPYARYLFTPPDDIPGDLPVTVDGDPRHLPRDHRLVGLDDQGHRAARKLNSNAGAANFIAELDARPRLANTASQQCRQVPHAAPVVTSEQGHAQASPLHSGSAEAFGWSA